MRTVVSAAAGALLLTAVLASLWQAAALRQVRRELAEIRETLDRLEGRLDERPVAAASPVAPAPPEPARALPPPRFTAPAGAAPAAQVSAAEVQMVDRKVEERLRARGEQKSGDRKMPLHDLAKELGLDPGTQSRVAEVANAAKQQILDLARTPRPDGTTLADDIVNAMLRGDEKAAKQAFARIFTDKVPGTDTTYLVAVGRVQDRARDELRGLLPGNGYERYAGMNVKPENIETGFDPWAEHVKQRGAR